MDLARRTHQSPGRLVDEDGLRGLPLAQRTGQGQSGNFDVCAGKTAILFEKNAIIHVIHSTASKLARMERPPFCLRSGNQSRDTIYIYISYTACTACLAKGIHTLHRGQHL